MSSFNDAMRRQWAKISQKLDQNLAIARTEYLSLSETERSSFRSWATNIAELQDAPVPLFAKARIQIMPNDQEDGGSVYLTPKSLVSALEAWDRGEEYLPNRLGDL
jgi:hypothetical protein